MKVAVALFLSFIIFSMTSLAGIHCKLNSNKESTSVITAMVAADYSHQADPVDDSQGEHVCHFGHSGHCSFDYTQQVAVSLDVQVGTPNLDYMFNYLSMVFETQKRPPIA